MSKPCGPGHRAAKRTRQRQQHRCRDESTLFALVRLSVGPSKSSLKLLQMTPKHTDRNDLESALLDYLDLNIPPDDCSSGIQEASVIELGRPHVWVTIVAKAEKAKKQETDQLELEAQLRTFFKLRPGELTFAYRTGSLYMEVVGPDWAMVMLMGAVAVADQHWWRCAPNTISCRRVRPLGSRCQMVSRCPQSEGRTTSVASHTADHPVLNLWLRVDESVAFDEASTFDATAVSIAAGKLIPCEQIDASSSLPGRDPADFLASSTSSCTSAASPSCTSCATWSSSTRPSSTCCRRASE